MLNDNEVDALPGTNEFKTAIKEINKKLKTEDAPRAFGLYDPFEEEYKYRIYLRECGYNVEEYMTEGQIIKADEQETAVKTRQQAEAARRDAAEWERRLIAANVPELHRNCTFENYEIIVPKQKTFVDLLRADTKNWFVFCGGTGTGKNHLAAAVIRERIRAGGSAVMWKVKRLMDEQIALSALEKKEMNREIENVDLLVLNEFGRSSEKKFFQDTIFDLLDERHENNKQTILITNLTKEALFLLFQDSAVERRLEPSLVFEFDWQAYVPRGKQASLLPEGEKK